MGIIQKEKDYIDMNESMNIILSPFEPSSEIYYFEVSFRITFLKKIKEHINGKILDE